MLVENRVNKCLKYSSNDNDGTCIRAVHLFTGHAVSSVLTDHCLPNAHQLSASGTVENGITRNSFSYNTGLFYVLL